MVRHISAADGFLLADACIAVLALSAFFVLCAPVQKSIDESYYRFGSSYLLQQSRAMASGEHQEFSSAGHTIHFNACGNVNMAGTAVFRAGRRIVYELGGGRLVYR